MLAPHAAICPDPNLLLTRSITLLVRARRARPSQYQHREEPVETYSCESPQGAARHPRRTNKLRVPCWRCLDYKHHGCRGHRGHLRPSSVDHREPRGHGRRIPDVASRLTRWRGIVRYDAVRAFAQPSQSEMLLASRAYPAGRRATGLIAEVAHVPCKPVQQRVVVRPMSPASRSAEFVCSRRMNTLHLLILVSHQHRTPRACGREYVTARCSVPGHALVHRLGSSAQNRLRQLQRAGGSLARSRASPCSWRIEDPASLLRSAVVCN